ncbi:hypothetical protein DOTSEDRAFT_34726 [Dothistroma septosporum NZE10]|uniref:Uncharacterized protein n=1 Tax=Dothistroma septosporum (strain NZE10 / CBS 128990) TaxID=675120 RepID=N1PLL7_DOTSN|nr:hypothetical protein DOTSEDRAFT_34726 [Dothistroma septosporum NZE10]
MSPCVCAGVVIAMIGIHLSANICQYRIRVRLHPGQIDAAMKCFPRSIASNGPEKTNLIEAKSQDHCNKSNVSGGKEAEGHPSQPADEWQEEKYDMPTSKDRRKPGFGDELLNLEHVLEKAKQGESMSFIWINFECRDSRRCQCLLRVCFGWRGAPYLFGQIFNLQVLEKIMLDWLTVAKRQGYLQDKRSILLPFVAWLN